MTQFNPDWYADSHQNGRNLAWYVEKAREGDQQAARRAIEIIVTSLTPTAQRQNGGQLDPTLADLLRELLSPLAEGRESPVLKLAVKRPSRRPVDVNKRARVWWACVDMHRLLIENPALSQPAAAAAALAGAEWCEPDSLAKQYRGLKGAVAAFLAATSADPD